MIQILSVDFEQPIISTENNIDGVNLAMMGRSHLPQPLAEDTFLLDAIRNAFLKELETQEF